jgi:hypothetical protein
MKKQLLVIVFICVISVSWAQKNEIGMFVGGTNYIGDAGKTSYLSPNNIGGSLLYKYNLNSRIALRGNLSYIPILGEDSKSSNEVRRNRNYSFSNSIKEIAVGVEYNFFDYDMTSVDQIYTPYILLQIAAYSYDAISSQIALGQYNISQKISYSIPVGLGFKGKLANSIGFAIESRISYAFNDNLDYTTPQVADLNFGGNSNDWYVFTGFSLVYAFGKRSCYDNVR